MTKKTTLISEALFLQAQNNLRELGKIGKISNRLQAIIASYKHGIKVTAKILGSSRATLHRWIKAFVQQGVEGLNDTNKPPRSKLNTKQKDRLKEWIENTPTLTLKELGVRIKKELGVSVGKSSIHRTLIALGFSHITGRKRHHQSNALAQEEFKKNSTI
jgi:transposase